MMNKKKILQISVATLSLLALTACGDAATKNTTKTSSTSSKQESTSVVSSAKKATKQTTSSSKQASSTTATSSSSSKTESTSQSSTEMNFEQIAAGNYTSLQGTWNEIGHGRNYVPGKSGVQYQVGGSDVLTITKDTIKASGMSVSGQTLTDNNGTHELEFSKKDGILSATIKDATKVAINWSVTFYPKGSTYDFSTDGSTNDKNIIVVWTSNNQYTQIFAQAEDESTSTAQSTTSATKNLNLTQIAAGDFASLVGTWKNPTTGETIVVTNKVEQRPADVPDYIAPVGAVLAENDAKGNTQVILPGRITDGYMLASVTSYATYQGGSPLTIIPAGVKETSADDSDTNKDRLIKGGGQAGFKENAYYKVDQ